MDKQPKQKTLDSLVNDPTRKMKTLRTKLIHERDTGRENSYAHVARLQLEVFCALTSKDEFHGNQKNSIAEIAKKKVDAFLLADGYEFNRTYQAKTWSQMVTQSVARGFATQVPKSNGNGGYMKHYAFDCGKIDKAIESGDIKIVITNPKIVSKKGDGVARHSKRKHYQFNENAKQWVKDADGKPVVGKTPTPTIVTDPAKCATQPAIKTAIEYWEKKRRECSTNLTALRKKQTLKKVA